MGLLHHPAYDAPCRVIVEQSPAHFHAHVEFDDAVAVGPGDRVRVEGAPKSIGFGESIVLHRTARVEHARAPLRIWTRITAYFDLSELYEVSFTPGRVS
jgi:hypothetical protein